MAGGGRVKIVGRSAKNYAETVDVVRGRLLVDALSTPASADGNLPIKLGDSPSIGAFDRLRVSNPTGLFESTQTYDEQPLLWNTGLTGGGLSTYLPNIAASRFSVVNSGDAVARQTRSYFRYQPGKSQLIFATFNLQAGDPNVRKRVGYFEERNGLYLEEIDGALWFVRRTYTSGAVVDNRVAQADWNLDTFADLDPEKTQILVIDFEWLGVGRVRVGFVIDGIIRYAHEFLNANNLTTVYMSTAQLPVRYEIEATGQPAEGIFLDQICCSVISEGGQDPDAGFPFSASRPTAKSISGTRLPVIAIRPKATFAGLANHVEVIQRQVEFLNTGNGTALVEVVYNPTLTGAVWNSVGASSVMEVDVAATALSGGIVVYSFYVSATQQSNTAAAVNIAGRLPISLDINNANPTPLVVAATNVGTVTAFAAMNWQEYR